MATHSTKHEIENRPTYKVMKKLLGKDGVQKIADEFKITLDKAYLILRGRSVNYAVYKRFMEEAIDRKKALDTLQKQLNVEA